MGKQDHPLYYHSGRNSWCTVIWLTICTSLSVLSISLCVYYELQISNLRQEQQETRELVHQLSKKEYDFFILFTSFERQLSSVFETDGNWRVKREETSFVEESDDGSAVTLPPGLAFLRGPPGRDGKDGQNGRDGRDMDLCLALQINKTITELRDEIQDVQTAVFELGENAQTSINSGTSYIRWGRTSCTNTSQKMYKGFAGGSRAVHSGGSSDIICMPLDPEYSTYTTSLKQNWLHGAEYEQVNHIFSGKNNQHVPCARCYTPHRSTTIMIPAKRSCPTGWTKEYEGYLMAERHDHPHSLPYTCMDKDPEAIAGLWGDKGHCPPYINDAELTCVVCTK